MEVEAAKVLWSRSLALHNFRYTTLLSDGDAKTFAALQALTPYGEVTIRKEECVNHVVKRLNTNLRNLVSAENKRGVRLGGNSKGSLTQVNSLKELCDVVNNSTEKGINKPAVVGWEDGRSEIPVYNWQTFFQSGKPLVGIKTLSHFKFECNSPGVVFFKANLDDDWKQFTLFSAAAMNMLPPLPEITPPPRLSRECAEYLHKQIGPFVLDSAKYILCPQPS